MGSFICGMCMYKYISTMHTCMSHCLVHVSLHSQYAQVSLAQDESHQEHWNIKKHVSEININKISSLFHIKYLIKLSFINAIW